MSRPAIPANTLASLLADTGDAELTAAAVARLAGRQSPRGPTMPKKTTRADLDQRLAAINAAHDKALAIAAELYPKGTRVGVMLSSVQKRPSPATIGGPLVCTNNFGTGTSSRIEFGVRLDNAKTHRSARRSISIDQLRHYEECL